MKKEKHGRLTVINKTIGKSKWLCICDCGNIRQVRFLYLKNGKTKSCGCLQKEKVSKANKTHGLSGKAEYLAWISLKARCQNTNNPQYRLYGGRGIKVEWNSFDEFYKAMGPKPTPKHSLDRIDNNGNYSTNNCRWTTIKVQLNNTSRNKKITYKGSEYTIAEAASIAGLEYNTLRHRIFNYRWSVERAMTTPSKK